MLPLSEPRRHLTGLLLLVRGDARGLSPFDISDDGLARSFSAYLWTLPAIALYGIARRLVELGMAPDIGGVWSFVFKFTLNEAAGIVSPILLLVLASPLLGYRVLLRTLIVTWNWSALIYLPLVHLVAAPFFLLNLQGWSLGGLTFVALALMLTMALLFTLQWRILITVMGGNPQIRLLVVLILLLAPLAMLPLSTHLSS